MVDYSPYETVCRQAVTDPAVFEVFKRMPKYRYMLEHVSYEQGLQYLEEIKKNSPFLLGTMPKFATNDRIGRPVTYFYKELGLEMSPTTLRYVKVLGDLINEFECLDCKDIIEIGVGYGGQAKIIHDYCEPRSYTLVDLPDVMALAKKCLFEHGYAKIETGINEEKEYTLVISNYAFTEISREWQDVYVEKVLKNTPNGYLTCNFMDQYREEKRYTTEELKSLHEKTVFKPEIPLTGTHNSICVWHS